ncbi:MAG: 16S rRNA processing protein RimM [Chloroflexota bacterium]|nr:16S rRNA processing protein RimM [Chloroflexota bacterium]
MRAPHGVRGEVRVEPMTDRVAERFRVGSVLQTDQGTLRVASVRGTDDAPIVAFEGIVDRDAAERLRDRALRVARAAVRREGEYLWDDLIGLEALTVRGERLGEVREILRAGGADVLVVSDGEREMLFPMLESVVREVDLAAGRIVLAPQEEA